MNDEQTVMPLKVVEVSRLFTRFLNKLIRMGYDEETIVKSVIVSEAFLRDKVGRIIRSREMLVELGYKSEGGRPRTKPRRMTYSERMIAKARGEKVPPIKPPKIGAKKGRRAKPPQEITVDDNERPDIE
jgi:hypothetical protein